MKILCMHLKIFLCLTAAAILLGIVTVTPCQRGQKLSLLGRAYALDTARCGELADGVRELAKKDNRQGLTRYAVLSFRNAAEEKCRALPEQRADISFRAVSVLL